eukprot:CAMPEP_0172194346 /NCGR_PEP_ID=MMETSP1050-20130122/25523_1 /TAXON_ID=233186 /ORGANISM="Cryptomonas curvata, Strain CCAP979/52" /LENGTH=93 /DNA_ID=CAMNT_0012870131 /DNA_START=125 /DNA_END=402 /DNA_ORIENTATION=-
MGDLTIQGLEVDATADSSKDGLVCDKSISTKSDTSPQSIASKEKRRLMSPPDNFMHPGNSASPDSPPIPSFTPIDKPKPINLSLASAASDTST